MDKKEIWRHQIWNRCCPSQNGFPQNAINRAAGKRRLYIDRAHVDVYFTNRTYPAIYLHKKRPHSITTELSHQSSYLFILYTFLLLFIYHILISLLFQLNTCFQLLYKSHVIIFIFERIFPLYKINNKGPYLEK